LLHKFAKSALGAQPNLVRVGFESPVACDLRGGLGRGRLVVDLFDLVDLDRPSRAAFARLKNASSFAI
jgi:hypothetical protein